MSTIYIYTQTKYILYLKAKPKIPKIILNTDVKKKIKDEGNNKKNHKCSKKNII